MAINFGELDRYGKVPANELKEKIRGIAYDAIREAFTNWSADEARGFLDEVGGIFTANIAVSENLPFLKAGDLISITHEESNTVVKTLAVAE